MKRGQNLLANWIGGDPGGSDERRELESIANDLANDPGIKHDAAENRDKVAKILINGPIGVVSFYQNILNQWLNDFQEALTWQLVSKHFKSEAESHIQQHQFAFEEFDQRTRCPQANSDS